MSVRVLSCTNLYIMLPLAHETLLIGVLGATDYFSVIILFDSLVLSVMLYGAESSLVTFRHKLKAFLFCQSYDNVDT